MSVNGCGDPTEGRGNTEAKEPYCSTRGIGLINDFHVATVIFHIGLVYHVVIGSSPHAIRAHIY